MSPTTRAAIERRAAELAAEAGPFPAHIVERLAEILDGVNPKELP